MTKLFILSTIFLLSLVSCEVLEPGSNRVTEFPYYLDMDGDGKYDLSLSISRISTGLEITHYTENIQLHSRPERYFLELKGDGKVDLQKGQMIGPATSDDYFPTRNGSSNYWWSSFGI